MTKKQKKMLIRILIAAALMLVLRFVPLPVSGIPLFLLWLIPYFIIGYDILRKAWKGILNRQVFDENFLMAVATLGALAIGLLKTGDYDEAVAVMLFYQIGELFQSYAVGKSRRNISELMDIRPDYANVEQDGQLVKVDPDEVEIGTVITVNPGEKIPLDGMVEDGESSLNTSALTGESVPRDVKPGDEVISGCINMSGLLRIRTTKVCPVLHPCGCLQRRCAGTASAPGSSDHWTGTGLGRLDLPGPDLPGHQLPLRAGHQHPAELLCGNRRRGQSRHPGQRFQLPGSTGQYRNCGF